MPNSGLPPGFQLDQDSAPAQPTPTSAPASSSDQAPPGFELEEDHYGGLGQQALSVGEGVLRGLISAPATALIEKGATALGVPGLSPSDQAGRAAANPIEHGLSEAAGFGLGAYSGIGEARAIGSIGSGAAALSGLGLEGASTISKIASAGIRTGAEMAVLQAGDETAKAINQDPGQSIGTAAINIGLSGLLGGAGGMVLGAISPLWKSGVERLGIPKLIDDAKAQYGFRQSLPNAGDVPATVVDELGTRLNEVDNMRAQLGDLKGAALERAMPELSPENTAKIDEQINSVVDGIDSKIKTIEKSNDPYLKSAIPKLEFHKQQLLNATEEGFARSRPVELAPAVPKVAQEEVRATPIRFDENPARRAFPWLTEKDAPPILVRGEEQAIQSKLLNAEPQKAVRFTPIEFNSKSYVDKFDALNSLKRDFQGLVNYERNSSEDTALGSVARDFAAKIRLQLEDQKVWGDAGDIQRRTNAAIKASIDAEKDAVGKFTEKSAAAGSRVVAPNKVNTLVNQSLKGNSGNKGNFIGHYLDQTENLADTINKIHTDAGLEAPIRLTPTPATNHVLGTKASAGTNLGNWLFEKGLATAAGHAGAEAVGGSIGALAGHPGIGALIGERMLAPAFTSIAKPMMENASRSEALKGSLDYVANVIRGDKAMSRATSALFKGSGEILSKDMMPNAESRKKLETSLHAMNDPDAALNVGGSVGHYLPDHATAAAAIAATAKNYLHALKPTQLQAGPLDKPGPIDPGKQQIYNRALDVAQQPLLVLHYAKRGTLQPRDVQTLTTIYPQLHAKLVSRLFDDMVKANSEGRAIPYKQRVSLSLLMGRPLDGTLAQPGMASIIMANSPKGRAQQPGQPTKISQATAKTQKEVNASLQTPAQAAAARRGQV